jgi:hypothetical protein
LVGQDLPIVFVWIRDSLRGRRGLDFGHDLKDSVAPALSFIDVEVEARGIFDMQSLVQLTLPLLLQHVESMDDVCIG